MIEWWFGFFKRLFSQVIFFKTKVIGFSRHKIVRLWVLWLTHLYWSLFFFHVWFFSIGIVSPKLALILIKTIFLHACLNMINVFFLLCTLYSLITHILINVSFETPFEFMDFFFDYKPALQTINQIVYYLSRRINGALYIIIQV